MRHPFFPFIAGAFLILISCQKHDDVQLTVETLDATEVTAHTAVLAGRVKNVPENAVIGIQYSREDAFTDGIARRIPFNGTKSDFSVSVNMLAPNREYFYRAFVDDAGQTKYGSVSSFSTLDSPIPDGAVDMGLSVYWASKNLGAKSLFTSPGLIEEFGDYGDCGDLYAWGETATKEDYSWKTYRFAIPGLEEINERNDGYGVSKYNLWEGNGPIDGKTVLDPEDDAASVSLGDGWRMPTIEEYKELIDKSNSFVVGDVKEPFKGITGYIIISRITGKRLFFPFGYKIGAKYFDHMGLYQSSSLYSGFDEGYDGYVSEWGIFFGNGRAELSKRSRKDGLPVRPVHE